MERTTYKHGVPMSAKTAAKDTKVSRFVRGLFRGVYHSHAAKRQEAFAAMTAMYISRMVIMPRTIQEFKRVS